MERKKRGMIHLITIILIAGALTPTPEQAKTIVKLEDKLMAPCCYSQTIRVHMSAEAKQMREEVTYMVIAGKCEQGIIKYYKAKYGETILVVPDGGAARLPSAFQSPSHCLHSACFYSELAGRSAGEPYSTVYRQRFCRLTSRRVFLREFGRT